MTPTRAQVIATIDVDEPDYPAAAILLGPDALPVLQELAALPDPMLASKAVYLASLFEGPQADEILNAAGAHPDPVRRLAAASGLQNLADPAAVPLAQQLLADPDIGVRKTTLRSAAADASRPNLRALVERAAHDDPEPQLRDLAARALGVLEG